MGRIRRARRVVDKIWNTRVVEINTEEQREGLNRILNTRVNG